ncbi:MAG TPA: site-specific DNA-methyltransferase [Ktedonobacteraceae bacterium]|nr:site-specific DNA-methyltransferase [Ktedonobacteraceae bacterium]
MAELHWQGKSPERSVPEIGQDIVRLLQTREMYPATGNSSQAQPTEQWLNRLIQGERENVLLALLPHFAEQVDLIYIDPPFMTGRDFRNGSQLIYSDKWDGNLDTYLQWLATTLRLLYRLLARDGSIYVHLDWRVSHYARIILDELFGANLNGREGGFQNEIVWHYQSGGRATRRYARKHDSILFYTKSPDYCFHGERIGEKRGAHKRNHMRKALDERGQISWTINSHGRTYTYSSESLMTPADVWSDISHLHQRNPERNGYATQKPAALLERILLASSEPGDLVLDCFCGSGVTPLVAEQLERRWIACDQGDLAISATRERLLTLPDHMAFVLQNIVH